MIFMGNSWGSGLLGGWLAVGDRGDTACIFGWMPASLLQGLS
jgi:hypothetical protein